MGLVLGDGVDQAAEFTDQPFAELDAVGRQTAGQCEALADDVGVMPMSA